MLLPSQAPILQQLVLDPARRQALVSNAFEAAGFGVLPNGITKFQVATAMLKLKLKTLEIAVTELPQVLRTQPPQNALLTSHDVPLCGVTLLTMVAVLRPAPSP